MDRAEPFSLQCVADTPRIAMYESPASSVAASQMTSFIAALQAHTGRTFDNYASLHDFSVREYRTFWRSFVKGSQDLVYSGEIEPVCVGDECETARFFPGLRLNYADNLLNLSIANADAPALTACHADGRHVHLTRGELRERVARLAQALTELGVGEGDCVVGVMRNDAQAVVAALAATAIGATLATGAPEMGVATLLDRFAPLAPRLLFAHTSAQAFDAGISVAGNVAELAAALPTLQGVVSLDDGSLPCPDGLIVYSLDTLINSGDAERFEWRQFAFNHPLFVMFSSGTTGKPKCIVHAAGGVLLEHMKEHRLHCDLQSGDRMYFHTSCAWMMWNWQLSALGSGVEIVTYDGPIVSVDTLWQLVANERVSVFGTSPAYLKMCADAHLVPALRFDLSGLRAMLSTGAVLYDSQFHWVRENVRLLPLWTVSGGTDIIGCFVLGNPNLPVYAGEAQCKSLALDVQAWSEHAETTGIGQLVCVNPFPSRPLGFFGDASGASFHAAYFASNPGVWTHGDLVEFAPDGGARLHGRSDGVLNVRGINVGPAEIYRVLNDIPEIREAMAVQQRHGETPFDGSHPAGAEQRVVLLVVLHEGVAMTNALATRIRLDLVRRASSAHAPDFIVAVDALPVTHNGKFSEAAARAAVNGLAAGNTAALRNPECLDAIRRRTALHRTNDDLPEAIGSREDVEHHLQTLWQNLFGLAPIGRNDNFFELGGHSLLAARLLAQVETWTGRELSLATLLVAPTIARLAAVIEEAHAANDDRAKSSPVLVSMRAGVGTPIFLVHSVTGTVMEFWTLVGALRNARPVFGLQALGLDGEQPVQQRVEQMAASYIEQMRGVQPHGPYALGGYSFGGLVAFEIAQQLSRVGERIEFLCLLDPYVNEHWLPWRAWLDYRRDYVSDRYRALRELPPLQRVAYVCKRLGAAARQLRRHGGRPLSSGPSTAALPPVLRRVRETMQGAMKIYKPRAYDAGPIVYVRATKRLEGHGDPLQLWQQIARGGLAVVEVQSDHVALMFAPDVHAAAAALDRIAAPGTAAAS
jgi:acetoacetyl-CoA synthetase